jgi:molybdopterin-containing oxidoreductase family membrane subunit
VSTIVQTGMWLERFVIVVLSLNRDFLPSSWGMYWWTKWDIMTLVGTMGFFVLLFFLFIRFMPAISISELRTLLPQSKVKE